jgi:hypothetical protein
MTTHYDVTLEDLAAADAAVREAQDALDDHSRNPQGYRSGDGRTFNVLPGHFDREESLRLALATARATKRHLVMRYFGALGLKVEVDQ